jgi:hypothetical protein
VNITIEETASRKDLSLFRRNAPQRDKLKGSFHRQSTYGIWRSCQAASFHRMA